MGRRLATDDLCRLRWLDAPRLSPDGAAVAYTEGGLDRARDAVVSRVYRAAVAGGAPACLTPDGAFDEQPRWSPRGDRLALVSDRAGERRIWIIDGGEARRVAAAPAEAGSPAWSPDGEHLAFVAPAAGGRQLWVAPLAGDAARCLTTGDWSVGDPAWSPDGRWIAFLADRPVSDLWIVPAAGGEPRRLTTGAGPIRALAWSASGGETGGNRALAFIGHDQGASPAANFGLWVVDLAGGPPRPLAADLDRSIGLTVRADTPQGLAAPDLAWVTLAGRDWLYYCFADRGRSWIGRTDLAGRSEVVVGGERAVLAFDASARGDRLAFVVADAMQPGELRTTDLAGDGERTIADANAGWLGEVGLQRPVYRPWRADDGETIDAWLVRPPGTAMGGRPSLILQIHGGPHYPLGERFYFEFQRLAALGYAVLFANPRGSQGYGERFATAIRGAWGDRDARDLLGALDAALADGEGDPRRLGVTGVSYGGYLTHLLLTRTHRFAAAVSENGIANLTSLFAANVAARPFWAWELAGTPETEPDRYRALSPLTAADRIGTPLLLVHAERDENCPIGQSEELYAALAARGGAARLARIPGEGHLMNLVGRPSSRLMRAAAIDDWFARHLRPAPPATAR